MSALARERERRQIAKLLAGVDVERMDGVGRTVSTQGSQELARRPRCG
jgi:hypothetical protein